MINYANSKIFLLKTPHSNQIYYGASTSEHLYVILSQHKNLYTQYKEGKQHFREYFKLFELGENDVTIELVENANCKNRKELSKRIKHYINNTCINNKKVSSILVTKEDTIEDEEEEDTSKSIKSRTRNNFTVCSGCGDSFRSVWLQEHIKCKKHLDIVAGIRPRDTPNYTFSLDW